MATSTHETQRDEVLSIKLLRENLALFPIIVSAVAFSFDVGFFTMLGRGFFTFFSLAEHLLFALEALPLALVLCFFALFVLPLMMTQPPAPTESTKWKDRSFLGKCFVVVLSLILIVLIVSFLGFLLRPAYDLYLRWPESAPMILFLALIVIPVLSYMFSKKHRPPLLIFPLVAYLALLVSFVFGLGYAHGLSHGTLDDLVSSVTFKDDRPLVKARILRSGERGLLLYDPASRLLRFERWDAIRAVESGLPSFRVQ